MIQGIAKALQVNLQTKIKMEPEYAVIFSEMALPLYQMILYKAD